MDDLSDKDFYEMIVYANIKAIQSSHKYELFRQLKETNSNYFEIMRAVYENMSQLEITIQSFISIKIQHKVKKRQWTRMKNMNYNPLSLFQQLFEHKTMQEIQRWIEQGKYLQTQSDQRFVTNHDMTHGHHFCKWLGILVSEWKYPTVHLFQMKKYNNAIVQFVKYLSEIIKILALDTTQRCLETLFSYYIFHCRSYDRPDFCKTLGLGKLINESTLKQTTKSNPLFDIQLNNTSIICGVLMNRFVQGCLFIFTIFSLKSTHILSPPPIAFSMVGGFVFTFFLKISSYSVVFYCLMSMFVCLFVCL